MRTIRIPYDALTILRAAAAMADLSGPAAQALDVALGCTDPQMLSLIEAAEENVFESAVWCGEVIH